MIRQASHRAMRFARELARRRGMVLRRFRLLAGTDDSLLGSEWFAESIRGNGAVTVWLPIGDESLNEALVSCTACRAFGGRVFGITISRK